VNVAAAADNRTLASTARKWVARTEPYCRVSLAPGPVTEIAIKTCTNSAGSDSSTRDAAAGAEPPLAYGGSIGRSECA